MSTYYTSKYSGEQIDEAVKKIMDGEMTGDYADRQLSNLDTPQGALANLGAGVRPNLLDNAIFIGGGSQQGGGQLPVNQRGQTSYPAAGYTIDRWTCLASPTLDINSDGITIDASNIGAIIRTVVPNIVPGKTYTLSVLAEIIAGSPRLGAWNAGEVKMTNGLSKFTFTAVNTTDSVYFCRNTDGDPVCSVKAKAAKLEEGSTQTLAYQDDTGAWQLLPQPESDYATQLAKCQRYLQLSIAGDYRASYISANSIVFVVPTPVTMRVSPTIIGDFLVKTIDGSMQTGFTFAAQKMSNNIIVTATKTAHGILDAMLSIQSNTDGFTAEL